MLHPHITRHAPNTLQWVPLAWVEPNQDNVRLFVEKLSLRQLEDVYGAWAFDGNVVLPDAPILRYVGHRADLTPRLVLLAGERRITAARNVGVLSLPCRVGTMTDEQAYRFILRHNTVEGLTTLELAFRAAEMDRLGFTDEEISKELGGVATYRYVTVGRMVNPDLFTDEEKLCDPSIVEWYEAARYGADHFNQCFERWNRGHWDEKACAQHFRKRGKALPIDNAEKGFRVTRDGSRLVIRGQVDLGVVDEDTAYDMLQDLKQEIVAALHLLNKGEAFGPRNVLLINPITV